METNNVDKLKKYIKDNFKNVSHFCKYFGFSQGNISRITNNRRGFDLIAVKNIEDKIFAKTGYKIFSENQISNNTTAYISDYNPEISKQHAVDNDILVANGWHPKNLRVIKMLDFSMSPTIQRDAQVLIDTTQTTIDVGNVYAIKFNNDTVIRRVIKKLGTEQYIAKPDNLTFEPELFTPEAVTILGRAVYKLGEKI